MATLLEIYLLIHLNCILIYSQSAIPIWINPCLSLANKQKLFCNESYSFTQRANNLVYDEIASLNNSLEAYANLTEANSCGPVIALSIPVFSWHHESLHGLDCRHGTTCNGPYVYNTTMFPEPISTASSFNVSLFYEIGYAISTEGRAMTNCNQSDLTFWAPNLNIFRDPRWGRGQETPGEDPFLTSIYGINFIRGMQGYYDKDIKYLKTSSCIKHFADYSLEDADNVTRHNFSATVNQYDQNDTYLVAWKYAVNPQYGAGSGVMCSYNAINGVPACADKDLLTGFLRNEMGFDGYVVSDCGAVPNVQNAHHYTNTSSQSVDVVYSAGMDLDCGDFSRSNIPSAVTNGVAKLSDIQRAVYNSMLVWFRLGHFDVSQNITTNPYLAYGAKDVCSASHLKLSLEATRQSIVLLKNQQNLLPLNINNYKNKKIALIGPNANNKKVMEGNYQGIPPFVYSVFDGLSTYMTNESILYAEGCSMSNMSTDGFNSAINIAQTADITIMVMGLDQTQESEEGGGGDRTSLLLPGVQNELIGNITLHSKGAIILIILSGGCVDISSWKISSNINAIIWGGYTGMYGGLGIANVLFGDFNPSARLTQTWYYQNYTTQILETDMDMRPNKTTNSVGRGYRYFDADVVYPFGYGLSYTVFNCTDLIINKDQNVLNIIVSNIGTMEGSAVVLIYFIPNNAGTNGIPIQRLIAFGRTNGLKVGQSSNLTMNIYNEFVNSNEQKNGGKYVAAGACDF